MAAPTLTQTAAEVDAITSTTTITYASSVTAGSTLVLCILRRGIGARTYTVDDNINGSWGALVAESTANAGAIHFFRLAAAAAGSTTITVVQSGSLNAYSIVAFEISAATLDVDGTDKNSVLATDHHCAASGSIDTAADVIVFSGGALNAGGGTLTPNASCTQVTTTGNTLLQHRRSASALTDERSTWTSSTARFHYCCSIAFATAASGGFQPYWAKGSNVTIGI